MRPPVFEIDPKAFWNDPYPDLARMRAEMPICFVPQLNAVLFTRRDDIFTCEKMIDVFSSEQPGGLMTVLMGENMMRKDGEPHLKERKQAFPSLSPKTVRNVWREKFEYHTREIIKKLSAGSRANIVTEFAMPVSGHALRHITGLTNLSAQEMDACSQGMMDGVGNYGGDPEIEARCHNATGKLDAAIEEMIDTVNSDDNMSMLNILSRAEQPEESIRANIKLAISGGQNEPRDAIAGCVATLLANPDQLDLVRRGEVSWQQVFEEYARWMSPIGMSPRRVAKPFTWNGVDLEPDDRVFFMFGSANRDEIHFNQPDLFDATRNTAKAISFGAGPHFCAGAAAARTLIAEVALPTFFEAFPNAVLECDAPYGGWAFRGPLSVQVKWN